MIALSRICLLLLVAQSCYALPSAKSDRRSLADVPTPSPSTAGSGGYYGGFSSPSPYGQSPQLRAPPPPLQAVANKSTATTLPAVKATQTLSAYTTATFDKTAQALFVSTLEKNIEDLSGSAVTVTINSIAPGSVVVASTTTFLSGNAANALVYQTAMTSGNTAQIFGTSFGTVSVDAASVQAITVDSPANGAGSASMSSLALAVATVALLYCVAG